MATNYRQDGLVADANLITETGTTITAGSLIWVDISGTNVVRFIRSFSAATVESSTPPTGLGVPSLDGQLATSTGIFIGVIANTQTGTPNNLGGSQTGVTWWREGVFEFLKTPTSSCIVTPGMPMYAVRRDVVRAATSGINASVQNSTGANPIGYCVGVRGGNTAFLGSATDGSVYVKIHTSRGIQQIA